jgi:hypothetical protein
MAICKLCRKDRDLRESHLVPEFMYRPLYNEKHKTVGYLIGRGEPKPQFVQKGLRENLLCDECESFLNHNFESPNVSLWRTLAEEERGPDLSIQHIKLPDGGGVAHVSGFDYRSFKLLLLSILWRASVSGREEFAEVVLGPHEEIIRQMLLSKRPGSQSDYPCLIFLFLEPKLGIMIPPFRSRVEGHTTYHFILTSVRIDIMVSRHAGEHPFSRFALKEDGSFLGIFLDHRDTAMHNDLADFVKAVDLPPHIERSTKSPRADGT